MENPKKSGGKFTTGFACSMNALKQKVKIPKAKEIEWPAWSKIVHVNNTDVYVVGGEKEGKAVKSTFKMDLKSGQVKRMANMGVARQAHGICHIGNFIYVVGGLSDDNVCLSSVERYDIRTNKWQLIKADLSTPSYAMTLTAVKQRYIYSFGSHDLSYKEEVFRRLDTQNLSRGWEQIYLPNPSLVNGCQYGVVLLESSKNDMVEFLVFGGIEANEPYESIDRTMIFRTNLNNFMQSQFTVVEPHQSSTPVDFSNAVRMTQEWRLSHLEPDHEDEFVCPKEQQATLAKVRWSEDGHRIFNLQFEMSDGSLSPEQQINADHEFTLTSDIGELQIGVHSNFNPSETFVSRIRVVDRNGLVMMEVAGNGEEHD